MRIRTAALAAILALCPLLGHAQGVLFTLPKAHVFDGVGELEPGAQAFFYLDGTSTKTPIYTTAALSVEHENPVEADAYGKLPAIFLDPSVGDIKIVIAPSNDSDPPSAPIDTLDDYPTSNVTAALIGAAFYPRTTSEVAAAVTPTDYTHPPLDVRRYGANAADGAAASDQTAMQSAVDVAEILGGRVPLPEGTWNGCITIGAANVSIVGAGMTASIIEADNCNGITLDYESYLGHNFVTDLAITGVNGSTHYGIIAPGTLDNNDQIYGVTIERVSIRNFNVGIHFRSVWESTILNNRLEDVDRAIELIGGNIGSFISYNRLIRTGGGGGAGASIGIYLAQFNYTSGVGLMPPEGVLITQNLIYGFEQGLNVGSANFANVLNNDFYSTTHGIVFSSVALNFNIADNYFQLGSGSSLVAGILGGAIGTPLPIAKVSIARNSFNVASAAAGSVGVQMNDNSNGGQDNVTIEDNFFTGFSGNDILVYNAGQTWIEGNHCASSVPTNSISVPSVLSGTVYIDDNLCTKAINWLAADAAAGKVVLGHNTIAGTTKIAGSQQVPTVASAAALTLPLGSEDHEHFIISGTTGITSIVGTGWVGRTVTLAFEGVLTVTDGGDLTLAGNFVTSGGDTITLLCTTGSAWTELGRSVN